MRCLVVLAALALVASACQVSVQVGRGEPPVRGEPEFGEVVLATEVDDYTKEPISEVSEFPSDVRVMHATINVKNVKAGSEFRFQWRKGDEEPGVIVMTIPVDLHDNWVSAFIEPTGGVPPGDDYFVDVLYNGTIVSSANFRVVDALNER
jgi:hypothetical protein